jgi:hypothetical protein
LAGNFRLESIGSPSTRGSASEFDRAAAERAVAAIAQRLAGHYSPYAVDWRFLPDEILLVKDFLRYHLANGSNSLARTRILSPLWVATIGSNVAKAVKNAEILFVHIPKTGGTSISRVLYRRNLPHYTARFWHGTFGRTVAGLPSFAVIRHPVERLVSAYKMAVSGGTDIVAYSRYWRARLRGLESFDTFVDHVVESRAQPTALPADLWEQAEYVLDARGRVMVDRLFSLDARRGLPSELGRWLSIPADLPHLNATPPLPLNVSSSARRKIGEIYQRDFQIYRHLVARGGVADVRGQRFGGG